MRQVLGDFHHQKTPEELSHLPQSQEGHGMSEYRCIGKSKGPEGLVQCAHTSATPSNAAHPEWGFLCPACSGAPPNRANRPQYKVDLEDTDKPNYEDNGSLDFYEQPESSEQELLDSLNELDLD